MKRHSFVLLLLGLLAALAVSQVATAAASPARSASTTAHPTTLRDDFTDLEGEEEEEEGKEVEFEDCEAGAEEFEFEEEEFEEAEDEEEFELDEECGDDALAKASKKGAPFVTAPAPCQVRRAESTITTMPGSDQVRLTIRYQTYSPTPVAVGLKLKDGKGAVAIERATKRLAGKGVLHLTTKLGSAVMDRAAAANEFDVSLRAPGTPSYCAAALEQRLLSARHTGARASRVFAN
ncbi:MAG: hypothetical protein JST53_09420 [Actinobacteria bacterium]|nr:hypothetical protein [Actinomycetota bacterium]